MASVEEHKYKKKKKLGSYPYFNVLFSITLALFVIGLFGLLLIHTQKLTSIIKNNLEVQIYLDKFISESNILRLRNILSNSNFIAKVDDDPQITFISKEEAARKFLKDTGEDFTDFLGDNPLRDAFVIKLKEEYQDSASLSKIKGQIGQIQGVFEVTYLESLVSSINRNTTKISLVLFGFAVVMLFVVVILINNTIKLALFSQRFLIRSMQLVGAKSWFIQWPFLKRSIFHGILGGVIASGILYLILRYANNRIEGLSELQDNFKIFALFSLIAISGAFIGFLSTYRSINKYLRMSLDELY